MKAAAGGYSLSRHPCERMSIEVLTLAGDLQGESSGSLLWVAAKVLMFLVPFLLLLRVVTAHAGDSPNQALLRPHSRTTASLQSCW